MLFVRPYVNYRLTLTSVSQEKPMHFRSLRITYGHFHNDLWCRVLIITPIHNYRVFEEFYDLLVFTM